MGKLNFSNFGLHGVEQMSRDEMKGVVGGNMPPDLGGCCLNEYWNGTGQSQQTCNIDLASAQYACLERKRGSQTSDYDCFVSC